MSRFRVSVIVVTYNSGRIALEALASALRSVDDCDPSPEFIVVDNASRDGSVDLVHRAFPGARVIRNDENVGFGAANNQAFELATGEIWVLLNPDAQLEPDAIPVFAHFLAAHPRAGAVAPSIDGPGRVESAGMLPGLRSAAAHYLLLNRFVPRPRGPWLGLAMRRSPNAEPRRVEWASAAAIALRPEAVRDVGGFDERIFLYGEDIDLCERLGRAGWEVWLAPEARARHSIAGTQAGISTRWIDGLHRYQARKGHRIQLLLFDAILAVGLALRGVASRGQDDWHRRRMLAASRRSFGLFRATIRGQRID